MSTSTFPTGTILGYPRIGRRRELKKAVEAFWAGKITADELEATAAGLRAATRERLAELGLGKHDSSIPEAFSYYDQVLDTAVTVGAVPTRFASLVGADGSVDLAGYFTIARGEGDNVPAEMTKWFDSNSTIWCQRSDRRRSSRSRPTVGCGRWPRRLHPDSAPAPFWSDRSRSCS